MKISGSTPIAKYAERKERSPKVAVFDGFAEKKEAPQHGDQVEEIIRRTSGLDDRKIQNYQNSYSLETSAEHVLAADIKDFRDQLRRHTIETATGFYGATKQNLDTIVNDPKSKVRVINQSQSTCAARVGRPFVEKVLQDEDFRMKMKEAYNLPVRAHIDTVAESLLNDIQGVFDRSRHIATARKEYMATAKAAYDRGIAHVVTAGNLGRLTAAWEAAGIDAPVGAYKSVLAHEYTTVIAATASQGTTTTRDDKAASFTSVYAGAEFAMHGVNVEVYNAQPGEKFSNGTSFSAPQATALVHEMFELNPSLTVPEMENILFKSTIPVNGTPEQVGAGQIDPERARYLAQQSRFVRGEQFAILADATKKMVAF